MRIFFAVRLVGGQNSSEGRVEVFYKSSWGFICGESWPLNNAHVICRSLGFSHATKAYGRPQFEHGLRTAHLTGASCSGKESSIFDCPGVHFDTSSVCYVFDGAGVSCSSESKSVLPMYDFLKEIFFFF